MLVPNHKLEEFVFSSTMARSTTALKEHLNRFLASFGIEGYHIVPAEIPLLKQLYALLEFDNKPRILWPACPPRSTQPQTLHDMAHKTPPG